MFRRPDFTAFCGPAGWVTACVPPAKEPRPAFSGDFRPLLARRSSPPMVPCLVASSVAGLGAVGRRSQAVCQATTWPTDSSHPWCITWSCRSMPDWGQLAGEAKRCGQRLLPISGNVFAQFNQSAILFVEESIRHSSDVLTGGAWQAQRVRSQTEAFGQEAGGVR